MNRIFKSTALLAAILCVVWVAVLWNWETTHRNMTVTDIALYLALLPLTIFGALLGLRWAWQGAGPRREAALAATAGRTADAAAPQGHANAVTASNEALRHATVQVLSIHVASNAGNSPADVLGALSESAIRPELDPELRDADGLAVFCARIADVADGAAPEGLPDLLPTLRAQRTEWITAVLEDHVLRALAVLVEPLANALQSLQPWSVRLGAPDREAPPAPPLARGAVEALSMVRMMLGWPAGWSEFEREAATEWVRQLIPLHTEVPLDRFAITAHADGSGEELWLHVDQLLQTLAREERSDVVLVTACHSDLSASAVAALEQQRRLFSSVRHPKGLMPGEAAAVLLLANTEWPVDPAADTPPARLHRAAVLRRDKSVEATGRISSQCAQNCITQALAIAHVQTAEVGMLICDADQHTSRGTELLGATLAQLQHLDPVEDMRLIGVASGHIGIVNTLMVIAVAADRARSEVAPCLAVCVGDPSMRLAVIARPAEMVVVQDT